MIPKKGPQQWMLEENSTKVWCGGGGGLYLSESVDVRYCLYSFECEDPVLDAPLVRYSSAGMSIKLLTILYRRVS